jgi:uncharacterized protein (TIGR00252 family)
MSTVSVGNAAEASVAEELVRQGFVILDRNWRTKWCEVDIIARKDNVAWFVEVKYRGSATFGDGLEYIGTQKLRHMQRAAELWVAMRQYGGEYTLGAVAVTPQGVGELVEI